MERYSGGGHRSVVLEDFTQQARRVLTLGQTEARILGHNHTGTEHLLLGLLRESDGWAAQLLTNDGLSIEKARRAILSRVSASESITTGQLAFTAHCREVIELAAEEARLLEQDYVGTEHLLLGLTKAPHCLGAEILLSAYSDLDVLRASVLAALAGPGRESPLPPSAIE